MTAAGPLGHPVLLDLPDPPCSSNQFIPDVLQKSQSIHTIEYVTKSFDVVHFRVFYVVEPPESLKYFELHEDLHVPKTPSNTLRS